MGEKGDDQAMLCRMLLLSRGSPGTCAVASLPLCALWYSLSGCSMRAGVAAVVDGASRVTKPTCGRFPSVAAWEGALDSERLLPHTERM